jgi:hypothetical protein
MAALRQASGTQHLWPLLEALYGAIGSRGLQEDTQVQYRVGLLEQEQLLTGRGRVKIQVAVTWGRGGGGREGSQGQCLQGRGRGVLSFMAL